MLKQLTEVQGVFYRARGDQWRAANHEGTTFCSGSPSSHKLNKSSTLWVSWTYSFPRHWLLPQTMYCKRYCSFTQNSCFHILVCASRNHGQPQPEALGAAQLPGRQIQQGSGFLSWEIFPFLAILCFAYIQNTLKTSVIFKYPQTRVK